MNPIALRFADGTAFFIGTAIAAAGPLILLAARRRLPRSLLTIATLGGAAGAALSATPLPLWAYLVWGALLADALVFCNVPFPSPGYRKLRVLTALLAAAAGAGMLVAEAPCRTVPALEVRGRPTVCVIGDSISAGVGAGETCWPAVLAGRTGPGGRGPLS